MQCFMHALMFFRFVFGSCPLVVSKVILSWLGKLQLQIAELVCKCFFRGQSWISFLISKNSSWETSTLQPGQICSYQICFSDSQLHEPGVEVGESLIQSCFPNLSTCQRFGKGFLQQGDTSCSTLYLHMIFSGRKPIPQLFQVLSTNIKP